MSIHPLRPEPVCISSPGRRPSVVLRRRPGRSLLPPLCPVREVCDADNPADILCDDVRTPPRQLCNQLVNLPEGVCVLDFAMQLPGNRTALIPDLEDNFSGGVREGHRAEILRLLRREDQAQTELPTLAQELLDRRTAVKGQFVGLILA